MARMTMVCGMSMVGGLDNARQAVIRSSNLSLGPCPKPSGRTKFLGKQANGSLSRRLGLCTTHKREQESKRDWKNGHCRASLPDDAPYALAIGAALLSTLIIPNGDEDDDNKDETLFGPDDIRSGAMQIISFIPFFNWLVWIFAWLDTRKQRYLAFAVIYLAPYIKTGLSLDPEDSWLPLASVLACIVHVQLDISVTAEGSQPPLIDISKLLLEKAQISDLRVRADALVDRLKELAERTDVRRVDEAMENNQEKTAAEWKAIQNKKLQDELREFDEKLARARPSREEGTEDSAKDSEP